jgi:hypothetical protein
MHTIREYFYILGGRKSRDNILFLERDTLFIYLLQNHLRRQRWTGKEQAAEEKTDKRSHFGI